MNNKDNNHIVDTNKKISSVEWFLEQIMYADVDVKVWKEIAQQAKAMHKEETVEFTFNYFFENQNGEDIGEYYQKTYGE